MNATLVLEDGTVFAGRSVGAPGVVIGEAVFNTGMTGYQEVLTDPSYTGQIVAMTAPHIGNTGWNVQDNQSAAIHVRGFVVKELARIPSNWRSSSSLADELASQGIVAIDDIDTRALTRKLRDAGAMRAAIATDGTSTEDLLAAIADAPTMEGAALAREVGVTETEKLPATGTRVASVVAVDYGAKTFILDQLREAGLDVVRVPATATADEILGHEPDGVFLSNGPGDPAALDTEVAVIKELLGKVPVFGICLGCQLLALALDASTYKLPFGHHGVNLPVKRTADSRVEITSQNHGFCIDAATLGEVGAEAGTYNHPTHGTITVTHINMNDNTVAGIEAAGLDAWGVQYHPEAGPGPNDGRHMFSGFARRIAKAG